MNTRFLVCCLVLSFSAAPIWAQADKVSLRPRVSGVLAKVLVKAGAAVQKGELLFELDATVFRAELAKVQAEVVAAEAKLKLHTLDANRGKRLFEIKGISREEFEKMLADQNFAKANLEVARASLELAKIHLDFTKIRAPIAGTFTRPLIAVGNVVKADETVLGEIVQGKAKPSADIRALQKERHVVLAKIEERVQKLLKANAISPEDCLVSHRALLEASLELAETPAERIELLSNNLKIVENVFKMIEAKVNLRDDGGWSLLMARAALLEARIRLLQEEEKAGNQQKR